MTSESIYTYTNTHTHIQFMDSHSVGWNFCDSVPARQSKEGRMLQRMRFVVVSMLVLSVCEASAAVCGDGIQEGTEQCEDGNTVRK